MKRKWESLEESEGPKEEISQSLEKNPKKPRIEASNEKTQICSRFDFGFVTSVDYMNVCSSFDHIHKKRNVYLADLLFEYLKSTNVLLKTSGELQKESENSTEEGSQKKLLFIEPKIATNKEIMKYHGKDYISFMERIEERISKIELEQKSKESEKNEESSNILEERTNYRKFLTKSEISDLERFGLVDDADIFPNFFTYSKYVCGATLTAVKTLFGVEDPSNNQNDNSIVDIAINSEGGRHHAFKSKAAGYCYINDVVLSVQLAQEILKDFEKKHASKMNKNILIIDTDVHHADATQEALLFTSNVFKISFHQFGKGLYPPENVQNGNLQQIGKGHGKNWNLNCPLQPGTSDQSFLYIFEKIIPKIISAVDPLLVIWVCGGDAAAKDPIGSFNLSIKCYETMITTILNSLNSKNEILNFNKKLLILGGGGYNPVNFAKIISAIIGKCLYFSKIEKNLENEKKVRESFFPAEIPESCEFFKELTCSDSNFNGYLEYELSKEKDKNNPKFLESIVELADNLLGELEKKKKVIIS